MDSVTFQKLTIELSFVDVSQPLSPFLENVYQILASEALADFEDTGAADRAFQHLSQQLEADEINSADKDVRRGTSKSGNQPFYVSMNQDRVIIQPEKSFQRDKFDRSDLLRRPVKERRRMFEVRDNGGSTSGSREDGSVKKLRRTDTLREKKQFWESRSRADEAGDKKADSNSKPNLSHTRKTDRAVSRKGKRQFWQSVVGQEGADSAEKKPLAESESRALTMSAAPPIPSPDASYPDSGNKSYTESQPECDQGDPECEVAEEVFERSIVTPATAAGYDNISLDGLFHSLAQQESRSDSQHLTACSRSGSHNDGEFIYDEFDEFNNIGEYGTRSDQRLDIRAAPMFQLNSRLGKMLGVDPDKVHAFGSRLYSGYVNVMNVFTVRTCGAGAGFLTVGVQGAGTGTAKLVTPKSDRRIDLRSRLHCFEARILRTLCSMGRLSHQRQSVRLTSV